MALKKKIYVTTNGCEMRSLEATKISNYFLKNGYELTDKPQRADLIIFLTCGVVERNVKDSLKKINELKKYPGRFVVMGCLPATNKEEILKIFNGEILSTQDLNYIDNLFPENKIKFNEIEDATTLIKDFKQNPTKLYIYNRLKEIIKNYGYRNFFTKYSILYHQYVKKPYVIKISNGCLGDCTFCVVKKAVGELKSKPIDKCKKEFMKGLNQGNKYVLITGDDTGSYGLDIDKTFPELLDNLTEIPGDYEIFIRGLRPKWISKYIDELQEIFKRNKITRIDVPIQSGSSRILKLMHRYSDTEKIKKDLNKLKKNSSKLKIVIHYMLGFPTETREEFFENLDYIVDIKPNSGTILPFSAMPHTKSEKIEPKVSKREINYRLNYAAKFLKKEKYKVSYIRKMSFISYGKKQN